MKDDFLSLLSTLTEADVDFVVIGGFAGAMYGCTLVTQDVDICCDFSAENLLKLQQALKDLNPVHRMTPNKKKLELTEENCKGLKNLYLDTDLGQLDCLSFIQGVGDHETVKKNSTTVKQFKVLNIDALIESKKALNRSHDKEAVIQLQYIKDLNFKK